MVVISRPQQMLRDYCRFNGYTGPIYFLIKEEKIQLHKYYTVQLSIDENIVAEGVGLSRRIAEFKAALNAINTISQNDPSILEFQQKKQNRYKNIRRPINRSFSEDYLSKNSRSCSIQSFGSVAAATIDGDQSATPSIEGIDSVKSDYSTNVSISTNNNINNNNANDPKRKDVETSSDEGVDVECSESSSSALPSPKLQSEEQLLSFTDYSKSSLKRTDSKSKFLQLFSSFSTFRRQSLRKSSSSSSTSSMESGKILQNKTNAKFLIEDNSRPNSSSSASSTSSAFSSDSSITSSTASNLTNGNHGDTNPQDILKHTYEESTLINNLSNGITETILEEDEVDNDDNNNDDNVDKTEQKQKNVNKMISNATSLGSYSSYNIHQQHCSHSHFSMCTPLLCNGLSSSNNLSLHPIESCLTLLKYCVRMYLPLPFYDLKYQQNHFQVTCRVIITISKSSKNDNEKLLPVIIPDKYLNRQFTAKGNGDALRIARNMAAERIIEKLKEANIYYEEENKSSIPSVN